MDVFLGHSSLLRHICTCILQIMRIQSPALYRQYVVRRSAMQAAANNIQVERTLWHGTSSDTLESINLSGFNRSYCGINGTFHWCYSELVC